MRGKRIVSMAAGVALLGGGVFAYKMHHDAEALAEACTAVETANAQTKQVREKLERRAGTTTVVLGDSYTEGQWLGDPAKGYAYALADAMPGTFVIDGIGGTGFSNAGPCGHGTFQERITALRIGTAKTIVLQGGLNDLASTDEQAAAAGAIRAARTLADRVVVVGAFTPPGVDSGKVSRTNEHIRAAANHEDAEFVDPSSWVYPVLPDQVHPTANGHSIIAAKLATALQNGPGEH